MSNTSFLGQPRKTDNSSYEVVVSCGSLINHAVEEAIALAQSLDAAVEFDFNGIPVVALSTSTTEKLVTEWSETARRRAEEYRNSPEGKRAEAERQERVRAGQKTVDELVEKLDDLDFSDLNALIEWMKALTGPSDNIDVKVPVEQILAVFAAHGFESNVFVGEKKKIRNDHNIRARWLIGQGLHTLEVGGAVHPVFEIFAETWEKEFAHTA